MKATVDDTRARKHLDEIRQRVASHREGIGLAGVQHGKCVVDRRSGGGRRVLQGAARGADRRGVGDADDAHTGAIHLSERFDAGRRRHHVGALDRAIGWPKVEPLLAFLVDRHEGRVDLSLRQRVGQQAGVRRNHELDRRAELLGQLVAEVGGDAARTAVGFLDNEQRGHFRRERDAEAKLAGGDEFFHAVLLRCGSRHCKHRT